MTTHSYALAVNSCPARMRHLLDRFIAGLGQGFDAYTTSRSRVREFETLNAKSDAKLAAMGLGRGDIARHVFRDFFNT